MTLKNLYLGLKDQLPWRRLLKNLMLGHLLGLFSKRSHLNWNGKPKQSYPSKASAIRAAQAMSAKKHVRFSNFKCIHCDGYHIGKNRDNIPTYEQFKRPR